MSLITVQPPTTQFAVAVRIRCAGSDTTIRQRPPAIEVR
jgi:hypothetical protein